MRYFKYLSITFILSCFLSLAFGYKMLNSGQFDNALEEIGKIQRIYRLAGVYANATSRGEQSVEIADILEKTLSGVYPVERVLTNKAGRKVEALIVGKKEGEIILYRKSDMKEFRFPTSELSYVDRLFIRNLPEPEYIVDLHTLNKRDKLKKLVRELEEAQQELGEGEKSKIHRKMLKRESAVTHASILAIAGEMEKLIDRSRVN